MKLKVALKVGGVCHIGKNLELKLSLGDSADGGCVVCVCAEIRIRGDVGCVPIVAYNRDVIKLCL